MDPYYFLDLKFDDIDEAAENCSEYPNGDWELDVYVVYNSKKYKKISFNNTTKKLLCLSENNEIDVYYLKIVLQ